MKTVYEILTSWRKIHGQSDPRQLLDIYCYSYKFSDKLHRYRDYTEIEIWCTESFGSLNWFRMFNKFWFTNEEQLIQFKLAWYD